MGRLILPSGSACRIHVSSFFFFFPPSVYSWQVIHKTFSWHGYFWGSPFATQNSSLRFLIIFLRSSLQDLVSHSFEQERAPTACLRTRSESLIATRQGLKGCSVCKVIHLNVLDSPSHSQTPAHHHITAAARPDLTREEKKGCWSSLESWCEEGECLKSDPGWKLRIMACTWTTNRNVQPELRHRVASKIWSLSTLEPSFIANFTG